jgi:glycosyltransferase involved in cell wall biosynthesis
MKFSLIMATQGRTQEIERFLSCLDAQSDRDFELIVVDQNPDDRLSTLLNPYQLRFPVMHLRSERGVSRARNVGLRYVSGEVVGFPDDDCWYPPDLLERVSEYLHERSDLHGITGRVTDWEGTFDARFDRSSGLLNRCNAWQRTAAVCLFIRYPVVEAIGKFDETLGPNSGTIWGGGEDIEYALRALQAGFKIHYDPALVVFHPNPLKYGYQNALGRAYCYGAGIGRVWRKYEYPLWLVAYHLLRPTGGALLSLITGRLDKARYHWSAFRGRLRGWLSKNGEKD